ncbi:uncharacterized protein N7479_008770 [Penicillium vulpinum]|uniref:Uncharacterized protein n=1 Tax=Penicillium vulpinum TaxID=29845 RepID=A0A1V6S255_9EURO|nr:uncharacterized protein N7479_008770 [Penicillium vulpinum]KAJ5950357.1 hypothetical protein N7479_008770 [Penicillium vulpinum]OQE07810.1 hypothetical protein PENVUL_c012G09431 [Penicillium vulpinum]
MGSTKDPVPPPYRPRELKMHDCLIEVTRLEGSQSAVFWLGGYLNAETHINQDGTFDPSMLSFDDFEQDLFDHLSYDARENDIRWDHKTHAQARTKSNEIPAFMVRSYNTWVAALIAMQHASSDQANLGSQATSASSPIMTAHFTIV